MAQEGQNSSFDVVPVGVGFVTTASVVETSGRIVMVGASTAAVVVEVAAGLSDDVRPLIEAGVDSAMGASIACNVEVWRADSVILEGCWALSVMSTN